MSSRLGWGLFAAAILALILVPFFLFAQEIEAWTSDFVAARPSPWIAAPVLGGLLAGDVLLPVPSSFVSTGAGMLLGFAGGAATSWVGMTVGCAFAYWVGAKAGRPGARRLVRDTDLIRVEDASRRWGAAVIVIFRAVPVLAEASVVFAGVTRMPLRRFLALVALSNLGISAGYAAIGAFAANVDAFVMAFGGAIVVPAVAMGAVRVLRGWKRCESPVGHRPGAPGGAPGKSKPPGP